MSKETCLAFEPRCWRFPPNHTGHLCGPVGSALDHRSLPFGFESQHGHIWRVFHLWLGFITLESCLAHLAYHVHKSGRKTSIIVICPIILSVTPWMCSVRMARSMVGCSVGRGCFLCICSKCLGKLELNALGKIHSISDVIFPCSRVKVVWDE